MQGEGRWGKPQEAHIQLHLAVRRDKDGSRSGAGATAGFDDYTLRRSYKHADRRWKEPTPPPRYEAKCNIDTTGTRQRV